MKRLLLILILGLASHAQASIFNWADRFKLLIIGAKVQMPLEKQYTGECLCGKTRYSILAAKPKGMFFCHCSLCRKETGTIHGSNIFFEKAKLTWVRGAENISFFNLVGTLHSRAFCKICGSPLPRPEGTRVVLPAGTLDKDEGLIPTAHIFFESRSSWEDQLDSIPKFAKLPE